MQQVKNFILSIVAALLALSAAIDAPAQTRTARKKPPANTSTSKPAPAKTRVEPLPAPDTAAPIKANRREASAPPAPAPVAAPVEKVVVPDAAKADAVRYSYEFKQPDFIVSRISIEHDAAGRGHISFVRKGSEEVLTDPLEIAPAALARIAAAWESLNFLDSTEEYQDVKQFPHLGTMTLGLKRDGRERKAQFNWTHNEGASALVKEYKGIGEQQLFVFEISLARQYQPSEAVKLFKRLEILIDRAQLSDAAQLVPLVRDLSTDERIPLIARNHAARLLKKLEKEK